MLFYIHPSPDFEFDPPLIDLSRKSETITIIELGSGSGMVAFSLAKLLKSGCDHLIATDLPEVWRLFNICPNWVPKDVQVCPLLQDNLNAASLPSGLLSTNDKLVSVRPLSWGNYHDAVTLVSEHFAEQSGQQPNAPLAHIICSDLVRRVYV